MRTGKGKGTKGTQKGNICLQTDHGVIKQTSMQDLPTSFGVLQRGTGQNQITLSETSSEAWDNTGSCSPHHSPSSQLTHASVVSCTNSTCQSHESLLLEPYQQQI